MDWEGGWGVFCKFVRNGKTVSQQYFHRRLSPLLILLPCHRSVNENWQKKALSLWRFLMDRVWQVALYCEGMLDKYLNWELTGTQIHKYAVCKYRQCKDLAKLSLAIASPYKHSDKMYNTCFDLKKLGDKLTTCRYISFYSLLVFN